MYLRVSYMLHIYIYIGDKNHVGRKICSVSDRTFFWCRAFVDSYLWTFLLCPWKWWATWRHGLSRLDCTHQGMYRRHAIPIDIYIYIYIYISISCMNTCDWTMHVLRVCVCFLYTIYIVRKTTIWHFPFFDMLGCSLALECQQGLLSDLARARARITSGNRLRCTSMHDNNVL